MSRRQPVSLPSRMQRVVRKVEAEAREATGGDPGTGQTVIKMQRHQPPLRTLLEARKIGSLELQAAEEIEQAVTAVAMRGYLAAALLERIDRGRQGDSPWPAQVALAVRNYQQFANYWSGEWKRTRNPMLAIVWAAVIDETPISAIANDIGTGPAKASRAIMHGLRHYAAMTGIVTGNQARDWLNAAQHAFDKCLPDTTG